jgi:hypothetical protein
MEVTVEVMLGDSFDNVTFGFHKDSSMYNSKASDVGAALRALDEGYKTVKRQIEGMLPTTTGGTPMEHRSGPVNLKTTREVAG